MNQAPGIGRPSPLNMSSLQQALPDYGQGYPQQSPQRYQQTGQPTNTQLAYQLQQLSQYGAPGVSNQQPPTPAYNQQFLQQFSGNYGPGQGAQSGQPGITPIQQFYANQPFPQQQGRQGQQPQVSQFYYQQAQFSGGPQMFPQGALQAGQFVNRMPGERQPMRQGSNEQLSAGGVIGRACSTGKTEAKEKDRNEDPYLLTTGSNIARPSSSTIRGPPRKPKQSGHALWVGNLPPGANVIDLKDHFSEGATDDILSVFLISKSNCAFVNYKTEEACAKAVTRFHDSRFQGVRLVCRLRRSSVAAVSGVPTGPAALAGQSKEVGSVTSASKEPTTDTPSDVEKAEAREGENQDDRAYAKDKYFVVKSLTVEDLETSVRTGIWATQAHNEEALNKAFRVRTLYTHTSLTLTHPHPYLTII